MERSMIRELTFIVIFLASLSGLESQQGVPGSILLPPPRPLCMSQFALVNHACSLLPVAPFTPPPPVPCTPPSIEDPSHGDSTNGVLPPYPYNAPSPPSNGGTSPLPPPPPFVPIPPPSVSYPPSTPSVSYPSPTIFFPPTLTPSPQTVINTDNNNNGISGHANRQNPRDGHTHENLVATPVEAECCRWLKEVDQQCVCDMLARLPLFLTRPLHDYHVRIAGACYVPFYCGGRYRV